MKYVIPVLVGFAVCAAYNFAKARFLTFLP